MDNVRPLPQALSAGSPIEITLIGAGGNGSEFFDGLLRLHFGLLALGGAGLDVVVFDDDTVSESNTVRQRFWPHEVGLNKADALVHRANLTMGTAWRSVARRFTVADLRAGLTVTAVDTFAIRQQLACLSRWDAARFWWLDMGCAGDQGQVVLGRMSDKRLNDKYPNVTAHFPDLLEGTDDNNTPSCSAAESLAQQDLMINQAVACAAINLLWKAIRTGEMAHNGVMIDLAHASSQSIPFVRMAATECA